MATDIEKLMKLEVNCETGEQRYVELTDEELAQLEEDRARYEAERIEREAAEKVRQAAKASALAKLAALGLTEEEVAAIAGA